VTRATETIGDLPIRGAVFRARALAQLMAGRIQHTSHAADKSRSPRSSGQAGMLLTGTGTVGSLCNLACAISDQVVAGWIRASAEVVIAPVAVAPSSA
jgi:hypothetical protein